MTPGSAIVLTRTATWPAVVALRRREAVVALLVAASIGLDHTEFIWTAGAPWVPSVYQGIPVAPSLVALALLAAWGWLVAPSSLRPRPRTGDRLIIAAGLVLLLCTALSAFIAPVPLLSVARSGEIAVGLLAFWTIAHRPALAHWLVTGLLALVVMELPIALLQEATQSAFPYNAILYPERPELSAAVSGAAVVLTPDGGRWQRAMGSFAHPNVLGGFLALTLVLSLASMAPQGRARWLLLGVWVIGWLQLGLSFSRTALLAAILGSAVCMAGRWRVGLARGGRRWFAFLLSGCMAAGLATLALAGPIVLGHMVPRTSLLSEPAATNRVLLGGIALTLIAAHPFLGVGAGNFSLVLLQPPFDAVMVDPVHAVPLLVAAESGVVAGLAWLALVLAAPTAAWRHRDTRGLWGCGAVAATILTLSLLDHYLWSLATGRALLWMALGCAAARDFGDVGALDGIDNAGRFTPSPVREAGPA